MPDDITGPSPSFSPGEKTTVDPRITKSLGADYEALKNDLDQANEFVGELQREVSFTKNDAAHFKHLFEKTRLDLEHMQESILALRRERHQFANEVMKARCWEAKVQMTADERDALLKTNGEIRSELEKARAEIGSKEAQVAELTMQVMLFKNTFRQNQQTRAAEMVAKDVETAFIERFAR